MTRERRHRVPQGHHDALTVQAKVQFCSEGRRVGLLLSEKRRFGTLFSGFSLLSACHLTRRQSLVMSK
jgi:hypothetical protein